MRSVTTADLDVAIIGAGPYGLSAAAHLRGLGMHYRVFGEPMSFWNDQMPAGMLLRSPYPASNIDDPDDALTLDAYQRTTGRTVLAPVPLERFVDYGRWVQGQVAPDLDTRWVSDVSRNGVFRLTVGEQETVTAERLIVAAGIGGFQRIPEAFRSLGAERVTHACEHTDLSRFAGKRLLIIGGGQSGLESAALAQEAGAEVEVLVRKERIYFLRRAGWLHRMGPVTWCLFAPAEVGPAGVSRLVSAPNAYRRLPRVLQDRWQVRSLRPAGAAWLRERLQAGVRISCGVALDAVDRADDGVRVTTGDGRVRDADHILLCTGYEVDIRRYGFLGRDLLASLALAGGYPRLRRGLETSVDGMHVVGAPAAWSYGPLMRFVAGTEFVGPAIGRHFARWGRRRSR
jgi:thioredoxin reductase